VDDLPGELAVGDVVGGLPGQAGLRSAEIGDWVRKWWAELWKGFVRRWGAEEPQKPAGPGEGGGLGELDGAAG